MGRPLRLTSPHLLFHVMNRGNVRRTVFKSFDDYVEYLALIKKYKTKFHIAIYHYALMPNHIHFLLEPLEEGALPAFMHALTTVHSKHFNEKGHVDGHVWQARYKSILIQKEGYFLRCARYIELNPVRAHLVSHPIDYPWTSYHAHIFEKNHDVAERHPLLETFGQQTRDARNHYSAFIEADLKNAQQHTSERFSERKIYGNEKFVATYSRRCLAPVPPTL